MATGNWVEKQRVGVGAIREMATLRQHDRLAPIANTMNPELQARLKIIPHLDLGLEFDLDRLRLEAARITDYVGYESRAGNVALHGDLYRRSWQGRSLIGFEYDSRKGIHEPTPEYLEGVRRKGLSLGPTDLAAEVPYMMEIINQLDACHLPARVMVIVPAGHLVWHSHMQGRGQLPTCMTVHIPIEMPERFSYEVTANENLTRVHGFLQPLDPSKVYSARYPTGRATCFNSYHYHNVVNRDFEQSRISIMLFMELDREIPRRIFERAVAAYSGPVIG